MERQRAVIDRVVDGTTAVLLLEEGNTQLLVPVESLPEGSREGLWLFVLLADGEYMAGELDLEKTREMQERIHSKRVQLLERMSRRRKTP